MSWTSFCRARVAAPLLAVALGCGACADEREDRRIDLGIRPGSDRAATADDGGATAEPAGGAPENPAASEEAAAPVAADTAEADTATAENSDASADEVASEPAAAPSSAPATGVGAPP